MGLSHQAILNAHPALKLVAVCDVTDYIIGTIKKYTDLRVYSDYRQLLAKEELDAVCIASPSRFHAEMVRAAIERGLHVFCEKPFCLDPAEGLALAALAEQKHLITQVGYHYRFVATFQEMKRLLDAGVIGNVHNLQVEACGPVVVKPQASTWRSSRNEGGGCLYDYASHAIDLTNFLVGPPESVSGSVLNKVFSRDVEDEVYTTLRYPDGTTAQVYANWSDESFRKMSMKVSVWGTNGRVTADRQELQIYLRERRGNEPLRKGWNIRNITELTTPVWYYLRGEEYSAQIDHFAHSIGRRTATNIDFRQANVTDQAVAMIAADASDTGRSAIAPQRKSGLWASLVGRAG